MVPTCTSKLQFTSPHQSKTAITNRITRKKLAKIPPNCHQHGMYTPKRFSKMAFATRNARINPPLHVFPHRPPSKLPPHLNYKTTQQHNYIKNHQCTHTHTQCYPTTPEPLSTSRRKSVVSAAFPGNGRIFSRTARRMLRNLVSRLLVGLSRTLGLWCLNENA